MKGGHESTLHFTKIFKHYEIDLKGEERIGRLPTDTYDVRSLRRMKIIFCDGTWAHSRDPPPAAREAAHEEAEMDVVGVDELLPEASLPSDFPESQPLGGQQPAPAWEERLFGVLSRMDEQFTFIQQRGAEW